MDAIRIQRACFVAGSPVAAGAVLTVPAEVDARDARALVRMRIAQPCDVPAAAETGGEPMPPRSRRKTEWARS